MPDKTYDFTSGRQLGLTFSGQTDEVSSLIFVHDDQYVIAGGKEGRISIWHARSGIKIDEFREHETAVLALFLTGHDQLLSYSLAKGVLTAISFKDQLKKLCGYLAGQDSYTREQCKCRQLFEDPAVKCE